MFNSNANWTKINDTSDDHKTLESAKAVCNILMKDYNRHTPCNLRGICERAWVTDENDNIIYEA